MAAFWFSHRFLDRFKGKDKAPRRRDAIYVDASFSNAPTKDGVALGGIGIWIPHRRLAITLQVAVKNSMEAETLALLAGAIVAKRFGISRPRIYSDCKFAVKTATRHLSLGRRQSFYQTVRGILRLSTEHSAHRHIYNALAGIKGTLEWRPREDNREADLASSIGSRHGNMGVVLSDQKNHQHALNDILSQPLGTQFDLPRGGEHRRGKARAILLASRRPTGSRRFLREAKSLIENISAKVA